MVELLWFVAYCGEFPSLLASRLPGHPVWNRHVKYRAISEGYVSVYRRNGGRRMLSSLRITQAGLDYIAERCPERIPLLVSKMAESSASHRGLEKIKRMHAVSTGLVMALNAGARVLPHDKPSLLTGNDGSGVRPSPSDIYYYSVKELRDAIEEYDPDTVAKTARIIGIIVTGRQCYCMYFTGSTRIYWRASEEMNVVAAIDTVLSARGLACDSLRQIIIGNTPRTAELIARHGFNGRGSYLTVSDHFDSCHFITNNSSGDELLRVIVNRDLARDFEQRVMTGRFRPPDIPTRSYDAVTPDGRQAVTLNYQYDLSALLRFDPAPYGFSENPILLCLDYQVASMQKIVGGAVEVRAVAEALIT